jgi:hypothetical protein
VSRRVERPRELEGTRLGISDRVTPGWNGYERGEVESHAREVHEEVLRESGFDRDRAREIAAKSADEQGRLLERHRDDGHRTPVVGRRAPRHGPSGFDIRRYIAGLRDQE